jgi:hypothetical protein
MPTRKKSLIRRLSHGITKRLGYKKKYNDLSDIAAMSPLDILSINPDNISSSIRDRNPTGVQLSPQQKEALLALLIGIKRDRGDKEQYIKEFLTNNALNEKGANLQIDVQTRSLENRLYHLKKPKSPSKDRTSRTRELLPIYGDPALPKTEAAKIRDVVNEARHQAIVYNLPDVPTVTPRTRKGGRTKKRKY